MASGSPTSRKSDPPEFVGKRRVRHGLRLLLRGTPR